MHCYRLDACFRRKANNLPHVASFMRNVTAGAGRHARLRRLWTVWRLLLAASFVLQRCTRVSNSGRRERKWFRTGGCRRRVSLLCRNTIIFLRYLDLGSISIYGFAMTLASSCLWKCLRVATIKMGKMAAVSCWFWPPR